MFIVRFTIKQSFQVSDEMFICLSYTLFIFLEQQLRELHTACDEITNR